MHGLLFQAKRKPNKNNIMARVKAKHKDNRGNEKIVYVVKDISGNWIDEENNRYTEESLDFLNTKLHH